MNSRVVTPRVFRNELLAFANRPSIEILPFRSEEDTPQSPTLRLTRVERLFKTVQSELGQSASRILRELLPAKSLTESDDARHRLGKLSMSRDPIWLKELVQGHVPAGVSQKFKALVQVLHTRLQAGSRAIIFVQTRATARLLSLLLNHYPSTSSFVMSKSFISEASLPEESWDVMFKQEQKTALDGLKHGTINVLVSTSVLEEGIDVSSCDLVVCYDQLQTFKTMIQRRGRARTKSSTLIVMQRSE